jgi:putative tryptophan/tyrosine transport system substrate-binding protein
MKRRDLLAGLLATAAVSSVSADDARKVHRIAVCTGWDMAALSNPRMVSFFEELRRNGYVEGTNLIVDRYAAEGKTDRYPQIVRDVLQSKPDAIVVGGATHELIIQFGKATSRIPIIGTMGDPVAAGIVTNLARPGANITGISLDAGTEMQGKHLELLKEVFPSASRIAYLSPRLQWEGGWGQEVVASGKRLGISIIGTPMEGSAEELHYRNAFEFMAEQRADAVMVNGFGTNYIYRQLIAELALKYRLPSIHWIPEFVELGGLMVYAPDYPPLFIIMAGQIDKILKGANPGDIPIDQPTKFSLSINLKTANALGLTVPATLLAQADRVIE